MPSNFAQVFEQVKQLAAGFRANEEVLYDLTVEDIKIVEGAVN